MRRRIARLLRVLARALDGPESNGYVLDETGRVWHFDGRPLDG